MYSFIHDSAPAAFVLVATTNSAVRIAIARLIAGFGMSTLATFDGEATITMVQAYSPEVCAVILDDDLPTLDGYEVARILHFQDADLPLIVLNQRGNQRHSPSGLSIISDDHPRIAAFLHGVADRVLAN